MFGKRPWKLYGDPRSGRGLGYPLGGMANRLRMLAVDLDGTLLDHDRKLSDLHRDAMRRAVDSGITVVLASGRALGTMKPFAEQIGLAGPFVACNGAHAVDAMGGEIHHFSLPSHAIEFLVNHAQSAGTYTNVYVRENVYASHGGEWLELYKKRTGAVLTVLDYADLKGLEGTKLLFVDDPSKIPAHQEITQKRAAELGYEVTLSERDYIEFLPRDINKGVGVRAVAQRLGFAREEVAAIGDWLNDLEMIEWAGLGGAVGNAADRVKEAASVVVAPNIEGGVAEFIDHHVLPRA
jgi:Cof subfamily protein (haloacid dehalogenase superfamily)